MNRVFVTGTGAVSACGIGSGTLWAAVRDGLTGVRRVEFPDILKQQVHNAAAVSQADFQTVWQVGNPRLQDRVSALALYAAREAAAQAGLTVKDYGSGCGVVVGTGYGSADTIDRNARGFERDQKLRLDPFAIPKIMTNAPASWISMDFGIHGPTLCVSTACSSGSQAIGLAAQMIRAGIIDRAIAGGTEALLVPTAFRAWEALRVMTPDLCRPFSEGRDGMVLGEGAGIVVLEAESSAKARGATALGELAGYATNSDALDLLRPDPKRAEACMREAIADAGLTPDDIAYVNAHGTGTVANDISEAAALRAVFGDRLDGLPVSSTKPVHGHAIGAAGALELIASLSALREQTVPPTINFKGVDPKIGLDPVSEGARQFAGDACMSNSFAFGGINACLVLKRLD